MKILHIIPNLHIGGAQRSLLNIIKSLPNYRHYIFSCENEWPVSRLNQAIYLDTTTHNFFSVIAKIQPQIVHFQWWPAYDLPDLTILRKRFKWNFKVLVTIQDPTPLKTDVADYYVACGTYVNKIQKNIPRDKIITIPDFIDVSEFTQIEPIDHHEINIVRHSMIFPNKLDREILRKTNYNIEILSERFKEKINFIVCGDGNKYKSELERYTKQEQLKHIKFVNGNYIKEVLSKGDIYLYNTPHIESEGFANVISEAEAASLPIIADNRGGNVEQVVDGYNGYLVDDYTDQLIAIKKLLDPIKRKEFAKRSRKKVMATGGLQTLGAKYNEVYRYLLTEEK